MKFRINATTGNLDGYYTPVSMPSGQAFFNKVTPTTAEVVFTDVDGTVIAGAQQDVLYTSSTNTSTWTYNGASYQTYTPPSVPISNYYLTGTTTDAGAGKTADIIRSGKVRQGNLATGFSIMDNNLVQIIGYTTSQMRLTTYHASQYSTYDTVASNPSGGYSVSAAPLGALRNRTVGGATATEIKGVATQNHSVSAAGAKLDFYTTPNNSTTPAIGLTIGQDQSVKISNTYTLPTTDGTANYFLKTNGLGTVSWGVAGLSFFAEAQSTSSPNNTVYANSLTAVSSTTNADFVIQAKGNGAILARVPDGTGAGGNKRGQYALDLQRYAGASGTYVAASDYSIILGGSRNSSNTGTYTFIGNGDFNSITGTYGVILNGNNNTVTGDRGIVLNGQYNQATAGHAMSGGSYCYAQASAAVALGNSNTASGTSSLAMNGGTIASATNAAAFNNASQADGISSFAIGDYGWANGIRNKFAIGGSGWGYGASQTAIMSLDGRTTNATPLVLQANTQNSPGLVASVQCTLANNQLMRIKGSIQGKQSGSTNCGVWDFDVVIVRGTNAASTVIVGTPSITLISNASSWGTPTLTANTTLGCLTVTVTGLAATNIQWGCRIDSMETLYA